jgi:hypothetical protein
MVWLKPSQFSIWEIILASVSSCRDSARSMATIAMVGVQQVIVMVKLSLSSWSYWMVVLVNSGINTVESMIMLIYGQVSPARESSNVNVLVKAREFVVNYKLEVKGLVHGPLTACLSIASSQTAGSSCIQAIVVLGVVLSIVQQKMGQQLQLRLQRGHCRSSLSKSVHVQVIPVKGRSMVVYPIWGYLWSSAISKRLETRVSIPGGDTV